MGIEYSAVASDEGETQPRLANCVRYSLAPYHCRGPPRSALWAQQGPRDHRPTPPTQRPPPPNQPTRHQQRRPHPAPMTPTTHSQTLDTHRPRTRSAESSSASPPRTRPGATGGSTANSQASAIGSPPSPSGRASKPTASTQHRNDPTSPGKCSTPVSPPTRPAIGLLKRPAIYSSATPTNSPIHGPSFATAAANSSMPSTRSSNRRIQDPQDTSPHPGSQHVRRTMDRNHPPRAPRATRSVAPHHRLEPAPTRSTRGQLHRPLQHEPTPPLTRATTTTRCGGAATDAGTSPSRREIDLLPRPHQRILKRSLTGHDAISGPQTQRLITRSTPYYTRVYG
ncbi:MAG: hypothetical protein ACI8Y4_003480 [Candidatus Poriferisodalaceae bacterium]